jgi:PAS domain S-box-containing protein
MHNIITLHKQITRALWCLSKIAEQAGEGIAVLDLNGTIRFVNAAWAIIHGYNTRHELVGKKIGV